jgi:nucleotide-binding universal stress UspA family protein
VGRRDRGRAPRGGGAVSGPLYRHIGCCIDDSPAAELALEHARALWSPGQTRLSLVHVAPHPLVFESVDGAEVPSPRDMSSIERAWLGARAREIPGAVPVFLEGLPGPEICRWAEAEEVDLLVAATRGAGWTAAFLGIVARHLVDHAPCPVLIVRDDRRAPTAHEPTTTEATP